MTISNPHHQANRCADAPSSPRSASQCGNAGPRPTAHDQTNPTKPILCKPNRSTNIQGRLWT
jgi:hypothetical protein